MGKLKELREKRAALFGQIDELRLAADGREMTAEEQAQWDALLKDYERADRTVAQEERFQEMEFRQAEQAYERKHGPTRGSAGNGCHSSGRAGAVGDSATDAEYRTAFDNYLLSGEPGIASAERKLFEQRAGIGGVSGGVLVPKTLAGAIEVALKSYGGMLEAGDLFFTSHGGDLTMPTVNDTTSRAIVVSEYTKSAQSAPRFGSETLKAYTYRTPIIPVSQELLQDSAFDVDALLAELLADSFGRGMNEDLTFGDGNNRPRGIVGCATASDATPPASAIRFDDLADLVQSVDSGYAKNGRFMFNHETFWALARLKDTNGRYLWQEEVRGSTPPTIFGKRYILNDDLPGIGPGNASVLFGDFSKYKIRMVRGFRVVRLNELLAEYLAVGLFGFARMDGTLLDAGTHPIKKLVHAAQ